MEAKRQFLTVQCYRTITSSSGRQNPRPPKGSSWRSTGTVVTGAWVCRSFTTNNISFGRTINYASQRKRDAACLFRIQQWLRPVYFWIYLRTLSQLHKLCSQEWYSCRLLEGRTKQNYERHQPILVVWFRSSSIRSRRTAEISTASFGLGKEYQ